MIAAALLSPKILYNGMQNEDMTGVAHQFGVLLRRKVAHIDLEEDSGILGVRVRGRNKDEHAVVLTNGRIYDPATGNDWDAEMYLQNPPKACIVDLLELDD